MIVPDAAEAAFAAVPEELAALLDNVVLFIEDDAPADDPTLAICETEEDVVEEVGITVVHEIAHHFGIEDDRLEDLGWG